jgi:hypothetical protein
MLVPTRLLTLLVVGSFVIGGMAYRSSSSAWLRTTSHFRPVVLRFILDPNTSEVVGAVSLGIISMIYESKKLHTVLLSVLPCV